MVKRHNVESKKKQSSVNKKFHIEWLNINQKMAWQSFQQHDVVFMTGPAGTAKTYLATAFAVQQILTKEKKRIILTRPIVESGEKLGHLPGDIDDKIDPYMMPFYDSINKLTGQNENDKNMIYNSIELSPIAYMRGRNFEDAVCIFDEAQNANYKQLKLFMTRFCEGSKLIITGDIKQSDLDNDDVPLADVMNKLSKLPGIGFIKFRSEDIVRHPMVKKILERLEE